MNPEREREDCHNIVAEAVSTFRLLAREPYNEFFYFPDMFRQPNRDECMCLFKGIEGAKEFYQRLFKFWVYTFFGFLENRRRQERWEAQAREALCEKVTESTMRAQIRDCKVGAKPQPYARGFGYRGRRVAIYRMFNDEKRVSFAGETTQNCYAFFYTRQTGVDPMVRVTPTA